MFSITGPHGGNQGTTGQAQGNAIGDCTTDTFSVATGVGSGTPIICGTNNNQHGMFQTYPQSIILIYHNFHSNSSNCGY